MSLVSRNNRKFYNLMKTKFLNTLMSHGKKNTSEKILLQSIKELYKNSPLHMKSLLKLAFINSTPVFKLNEQFVKKGKRKIRKQIPIFLTNDLTRLMQGFRMIKQTSTKTRSSEKFFKSLSRELLNLTEDKSISISNNSNVVKQVLLNKRYLSKFRWK